MSIISYGSLTVRKTVATLIGPDPSDISATYRMPPFPNGTGTYFAFITNRGADNLAIFESGPTQPLFLGPDDVNIVLAEGPNGTLQQPTAVVDDRTFVPGCYFVTRGNRTLCHAALTHFAAPPMPPFPNVGALREFKVLQQTDPSDPFNPVGVGPSDLCCGDNIFLCQILGPFANRKDLTTNGIHQAVRRIYVANSGEGTVSVISADQFLLQTRITIPGVSLLTSYYP